MKRIRTAVIGCGKAGHFHALAFQSNSHSDFVACLGHHPDKTDAFAAQYGVRGFTDLDTMIRESQPEAVAICTPHPLHAAFAVPCLEHGIHVAIEKPLAASLSDCDAILKAQRQSGAVGTTICQRRFYRPSMRIREAIDAGKIGRPILGTVNMLGWRDMAYYASDPWRGTWKGECGGVLINQAPHQIDMLLWYMGDVDELYGIWDTLNHPNLEVDDTAAAVIRFKSGAIGNIVVSNSQNPALFGNVRVHGSNGASIGVQTDAGAMFVAGMTGILEPPVNDLWTVPGEENLLKKYQEEDRAYFNRIDGIHHYHAVQINDFLEAILSGRKPMISLEDGRKTVELVTAIYRSRRDRTPIRFPLVPETGSDYDGRLAGYRRSGT